MMTNSSNTDTIPFLKWAGGKRWLAPAISTLLSNPEGKYVEPFIGGGAVFFSVNAKRAYLADCNDDLICAYRAVRSRSKSVIDRLSSLSISKTTFMSIRASCPSTITDRGVRLIYLNRTSFNGLYRVNQKGKFNVPFGCKPGTTPCNADAIRSCALKLRGTELETADFRASLSLVAASDAVYIDPPYTVRHNNNAFRRYNESIFTWDDQKDLAIMANRLSNRGVDIAISNALHPEVISLYDPKSFIAFAVGRRSRMAANAQLRGECEELLLLSQSVACKHKNLRAVLQTKFRGPLRRITLKRLSKQYVQQ